MRKAIILIFLAIISYGTGFAQINIEGNGITDNKIIVDGKEYYLYKVKEKEGFYSLEKKFGVSRVEIVEANPETAQGLKKDQIIKIPVVAGRNSSKAERQESGDFIYHTVEKGQNIFFISRKYGVEEEDIFKYNPQSRDILIIGTELKIPVHKVAEVEPQKKDAAFYYHVVKPGESLYGISKSYQRSLMAIVAANPGLQSENIPVGSEIRIPKVEDKKTSVKPAINAEKDSTIYVFEDEKYFYHKIEAKETFYSIISKYNVEKEAVLAVNNIQNPASLNVGYIIKIPKNAIRKVEERQQQMQDKGYLVYKVINRKESIEEVAKKFSLTVEELKEANPDYKWWMRYRKGDLVKIPTKDIFKQPDLITKNDSGSAKPKTIKRDSILLAEAFVVGCDTQYYDHPINVAVLWPFYLSINDTFNIVRKITDEGDTIISEKNPLEVFPMSDNQGFREFYEGVILAIDSLQRKGFDINLFTYDTEGDTNLVKKLLAREELASMDLIIGPAFSSNVRFVTDFCFKNGIYNVVPYSSHQDVTNNNPFVIQVNPYQTALFSEYISYIVDKHKGDNIILVHKGEKSKEARDFTMTLKRTLFSVGSGYYQPVSFKEVDIDKYGFQGLEKVIDPEKLNVVLLSPEASRVKRNELFSAIVPTIENMVVKKRMNNIMLLGYPDNQRFTGRDLEYVFMSDAVLYTPFYVDFESDHVQKVIRLFRYHFNTDPTSAYPYFGLLGFDITNYFLHAIHEFGPNFQRCLPYLNVPLTTSGFEFQRKNNWSGLVNKKINFLNYQRSFDVVKLNYTPKITPANLFDLSKSDF